MKQLTRNRSQNQVSTQASTSLRLSSGALLITPRLLTTFESPDPNHELKTLQKQAILFDMLCEAELHSRPISFRTLDEIRQQPDKLLQYRLKQAC